MTTVRKCELNLKRAKILSRLTAEMEHSIQCDISRKIYENENMMSYEKKKEIQAVKKKRKCSEEKKSTPLVDRLASVR